MSTPTREDVVEILTRYAASIEDAEDVTVVINRGLHKSPEMISFDLPVTSHPEFLVPSRG